MRFLRVRGWYPEEKDRDRQFIVEAVNGTPIAAEGRLYAMTRDGSGTYSVYDVRTGLFVFGGQTIERAWKIIKKPRFRERAEQSIRWMVSAWHATAAMMARIRAEYEYRGKQDMELQKVWETANRQVVTESDAKSIEDLDFARSGRQ